MTDLEKLVDKVSDYLWGGLGVLAVALYLAAFVTIPIGIIALVFKTIMWAIGG